MLAAGFADLLEQQALRPHPCLRPRRLTEDLQVCGVAAVEDPRFNVREQSVEATLHDGQGQRATLVHSYYSRGRSGAEALMRHLRDAAPLFVAGKVRLGAAGLAIAPTGLVFEHAGERRMLQPWVDENPDPLADAPAGAAGAAPATPLRRHLAELLDLLGECGLVGRAQVPERLWRDLREQSKAAGLPHVAEWIAPASALTLSAEVVYGLAGPDGMAISQ